MVAHAPLEPSMPFTLDLLDAVEDDGDFVIAGTCRTPIERHESGTQLARRWRPARRRRLPRRRRQNAAQRCKVIGRLAQRSKTAYEKGNSHGCPRNVGALDDQLKSRPVGTQYDVLATTAVDQNLLEARHGGEQDAGIISGRDLDRLGDSRECCGADLWEPEVMRLQGRKGGVGERSRAPTLQQEARAPASA